MTACRQALRARPGGRPGGDGGAVHPLGDGEVGPVARAVSGGGSEDSLERCVARGVVDVAVLPDAPNHGAPGAAEDAGCVLVAAAAGSGAVVDVLRPRVVSAAAVGEHAERVSEPVIARPAK